MLRSTPQDRLISRRIGAGVLTQPTPKITPHAAGPRGLKWTPKIGQVDKLRTASESKGNAEVSTMSNKRKLHPPEFKAKVSLDAIKGMKTSSELASHYTLLISIFRFFIQPMSSK